MDCTAQGLADAANCITTCTTRGQRDAIKVYLLATIAGVSANPSALVEASKCFNCLTPYQIQVVNTWLLCQIANK